MTIRFAWLALGAASVLFHVGLIFSGLVPNLISRPVHMLLALPWALIGTARTRAGQVSGVILTGLGAGACIWVAANESALGDQYGALSGAPQVAGSLVLLIVVLEMARRAIGWPLPLVATIALAYGLLGHLIPGEFGHPGMRVESFLGTLTITEGGIWGALTGVSVGVVAIFVIFGAVLNAGEAGQGFMNIAGAAAGRLRAGAAKVSVIASALFGSISGSASANVASTGAITLPAMLRLGYPASLAGAVEAVASSGGQIMPPLMGAGAFVMVELIGVPYTGIMAAALLPAVLYFLAVWFGIDAYSHRHRLAPIPPDERPSWNEVVVTAGFFLVPFGVLLYGMFVGGFTPQFAACLAILAGFALLLVDRRLRVDGRKFAQRLETAMVGAGRQIAVIGSIILCAAIVVGVLGITGLGVKITSLILSSAGGALWPALLLTALACLILGMEVPTTAAYVICVAVAGPALIELGLEPLQAHLFVFWFALLSTITPPVCGAVFIAAGMVDESWLKVAATSMALGVGLYLIPLAMVANPGIIRLDGDPLGAILSAAVVAVGLALVSRSLIVPGRPLWRIGLAMGGLIVMFVRPALLAL
ncbi:MAG: TRAP transporter fused permease subunit [Burkholderiaceae bacterium]|nr:TRAP transporter fused permease subunit [Burkholderiaceae bacterium]